MNAGSVEDPEEDRSGAFGAGDGEASEERLSTYYHRLGDGRRELFDRSPIEPTINIAAALRRMPAHWLTAACTALQVEPDGAQRTTRKIRSAAVLGALQSHAHLAAAVATLPRRSLDALRVILESGGCVALIALTQEYGDMFGDGWLWDERRPQSCLGELRWRAFLHVGRLRVEQDGGLPDLYVSIAVVPQDLRAALCELLHLQVDDPYLVGEPTSGDEVRCDALDDVLRDADLLDDALGLDRPLIDAFLRRMADEGTSARLAWEHLDVLLEFAAHNLHEIRTADDMCGFHLSELATSFVDRRQSPRWTLVQRRALIESVVRLYEFLHEQGRASAAALEEMRDAARTLLAGKRRLNLVRRPPALGGEPVFLYEDEGGAGQQIYTINHRRIAVVWWTEFDQDWDAMLVACGAVVDGARKAAMARELMNLDASICELLLACADQGEPELVGEWFHDDPMLFVRAW